MILDAHRHIWDCDAVANTWITNAGLPTVEPLPDAADSYEQRRFILVEADADDPVTEADWLVSQVRRDSRVYGAIVCIELESPQAYEEIRRLADTPEVVGVRRVLQDRQLFDNPVFFDNLRRLATHDMPFDACVRDGQLPALIDLAHKLPSLSIVLDHMGKPPVGQSKLLDAWFENLRQLAQLSNVYCKISGLPAECLNADQLDNASAGIVRTALDVFTAERCLLGSDLPISQDDQDWCMRALRFANPSERDTLRYQTAEYIYGRRS